MGKRLLVVFGLLLVLVTTGSVLFSRHQVENENRTITLLVDGLDILRHSEDLSMEPLDYFVALREAGLQGVIVFYDNLELRDLVNESGLGVVPLFDKTPIVNEPVMYDLSGTIGLAFNDSHTTSRFLNYLTMDRNRNLLFLVQRNDTFRGYLPSEVHSELIAQRYPAVRTYRISRWETDSVHVTPDTMPERWLMNIREYNTRALWARPFLDLSMEENIAYIQKLIETLNQNGYSAGIAQPFTSFYPGGITTAILIAGVLGLMLLLCAFLQFPQYTLWLGTAGVPLVALLSLVGPLRPFLRLGVALVGAVAASSLGLIWVQGKQARRLPWWAVFTLVNTITLTGALMTAALLSDTDFFMEYSFFRGVKVQYALPLFLVGAYLIFRVMGKAGFIEVTNWPLPVTVAVALGGVTVVGIYMLRSGDVGEISSLELLIRHTLDRVLVARPRFKELIGHPLLLLTLYWRPKLPKAAYSLGIIGAAIAQVSLVNTFLHVRTPLYLSLLRTFHALWMGVLIGGVLVLLSSMIVPIATEHWRQSSG